MHDFKTIEPEMLKFWEKNRIYEKAKKKGKGKKKYYFLDGPPYTSGKVHIGTAWNKSLKDLVLRYKRMQGFDVWDRAGYDMHGLPTAHAVQKKLKLLDKDAIVKFGVGKFIKECEKLSVDNMKIMNVDFKRLGVWMDFENAYQSITKEFIESVWWLVKKAHDNKRLYEGLRTMHWCADCATALAKHELEYREVTDDSIFVKFPVKGKKNEYLIIWTTTPWTIPFNLGVMVNPELSYVKAKVKDEVWVVAKALAGILIQSVTDEKLEVLEEFNGDKLEGVEYEHPFSDIMSDYKELKKKHPKLHTIVLSKEYVDTTAGSGLVHMAPGCGPEDYEVGHRNNIPPYNSLSETGVFPKSAGKFAGWVAKKDDQKFVEEMKSRGVLIEVTPVEHDYAHCWRCHNPIIYRTTKQWFFKVEDMKKKLISENKKIKWVPIAAFNAFESWLNNLRDNSITKQRFWGTPLPVWKCGKCGEYDVIGNAAELKKLAGKVPDDLHKPWIDEVTIPCKCGEVKKRIPDIMDVWVDAGTTSWNCLDYPHNEKNFKDLFPAEFILEGKDQIRGWFNLLHICSMVSMGKPSFKSVYMHGFVQDAQGRKMSKSLGNYILPEEVIKEYGADTLRYYMIGGAMPGIDISYNMDDMKLKHKNLAIIWNLQNFIINYSKELGKNPAKLKPGKLDVEEKYIISKLNSTIEKLTSVLDNYEINYAPGLIEELFLELSRTYIQFVREKSALGSDKEKEAVLYTIYNVFTQALKMFSIVAPFITEKIYQNLKDEFGLKEESVHLFNWPKSDKKLINKELEEQMGVASNIIQAVLYGREKLQQGVRWPLAELVIATTDDDTKKAIKKLEGILKVQTNIKKITVSASLKGVTQKIRAEFKTLGPDFGDKSPKIIAHLAQTSAESILKKIEEKGKYEFKLDGHPVSIKKDHLVIERQVPDKYQDVDFKHGVLFLNKEMTPELEEEGFAREVMRRVQALRKKAGLNKPDRIKLTVASEVNLDKWKDQIAEKVGAKTITIVERLAEETPAKPEFSSKEKVKGKEFEIAFDKL